MSRRWTHSARICCWIRCRLAWILGYLAGRILLAIRFMSLLLQICAGSNERHHLGLVSLTRLRVHHFPIWYSTRGAAFQHLGFSTEMYRPDTPEALMIDGSTRACQSSFTTARFNSRIGLIGPLFRGCWRRQVDLLLGLSALTKESERFTQG